MNVNSFSCIIVDDEPLSASLLEKYTALLPDIILAGSFTNPFDALHFLENNKIDFILLDVQMPELTGLQFMEIIKNKSLVILTTAYSDYAIDAFDFDVVDYLLKPITYERFTQAIKRVRERALIANALRDKPVTSGWFFVKSGYKMLKINFDEVLYLEGLRDYVTIHTESRKILTLQSMKNFEENLPDSHFIRVHKSYIINIGKIASVEKSRVLMDNMVIPVGNTFEQNFKKKLKSK
jgi:two-component system, LytTR family, response regulator